MTGILAFLQEHWVALLAFIVTGVLVPSALKIVNLIETKGVEWVHTSLEHLRSQINSNEIAAQIQADDAIIDILEDYLPEVIHEMDGVIQNEISVGKFSSLDWTKLGEALWAKGRAEIETGTKNYMEASGEKDGKVIAALVARKFFTKQAALQKNLIKE